MNDCPRTRTRDIAPPGVGQFASWKPRRVWAGPVGPVNAILCRFGRGSLPCEERWHLLAEDGTSEVGNVSAPVTPMNAELTRIEVSESRRDQIRRGWATSVSYQK